ncbi:fatty acid desaturase [Sphingorhabdus sp. EL138]|uniref:fatty acid desaturase family protein n=1 Tax=Sphingorhabdus sp. EL138 TaxID=2073156 RepID=UPI0013A5AB84|nr:fatty acid desaturase [Sphingorhabdus sp. EL138]
MKRANNLRALAMTANEMSGQRQLGTILLCLGCSTVIVGTLALSAIGQVPVWIAGVANYFAIYSMYTALHEAVHGNIGGTANGDSFVDRLIGRVAGFFTLVPFSAHKTIHLDHHKYTNDPARDPDHYIKGKNFLDILLRCMTITVSYVFHARRNWDQPRMRSAFWWSVWAFVQTAIILTALGLIFGWQLPVIGYLIPAMIATPTLGFLFDWIVHKPHEDPARFRNTTVFEGNVNWLDRLYTWATLQQSYHGIHHAFPRIPFNKYRTFFKSHRMELMDSGLPVKRF